MIKTKGVKVNYWLLTTEYPPFYGGGIGTYCNQTAEMLADKGHNVSVFINDHHISSVKSETVGKIRIIRFNPSATNSQNYLGHVTNISYEFANVLKEFILKEGPPDIIEAQEYLGIAYYLLQFKYLKYDWCKNIPVLITMHSPSFLYMEYNNIPLYRFPNYWICEMERFCLQAADQIISPSRFMINELAKRFQLTNAKIDIIPNPFQIKGVYKQTLSQVKPDQIVFYGKLTAQKGAFKLMQYFQQLWDDGFDRSLHLLGGQDIVYHAEGITMGDIIRKKYKKYLLSRLLKMEDRVAPQDVPTRLGAAEIVIVPSNNDNLPYVVFEMMALGKVLLVSKQGGHTEVITDGIDGFIFDHDHPETFASQLNRILSLSSAERNQISANALKRVTEHYNAEEVYRKKNQVINSMLANKTTSHFPYIRLHDQKLELKSSEVEKNLLSVIIPYFNMGRYIDDAVETIINSDYIEKEIIIINDGSNEEQSVEKLKSFRNKNNIRVMDISNGGLGNARNYGAKMAKGEFIAFLDADDTIHPTYYSKAIKVLRSYDNVHFVGSWIKYFEDSSNTWPAFHPEPPLILYHNLTNSSSLVFKRNSFLECGTNDTKMTFSGWEDYESVISMTEAGLKGVVLPEKLFNYRIRKDSMIRSFSKEKKLVVFEHISKKHNSIYSRYSAELFNLQNANGPGLYLDNPSLDYHLADKIPFGGKISMKLIKLVKRNRYTKLFAYKIYRLINK